MEVAEPYFFNKGCKNAMEEELVELVAFLIRCLTEEKALVRAMGCWTLSRYIDWMVGEPHHLKLLMKSSWNGYLTGTGAFK